MDAQHFASRPSSPPWEVPRDFGAWWHIDMRTGKESSKEEEIPGPRAQALDEAACTLQGLCDHGSIISLQGFFSKWTNNGVMQPNALAWFEYRNPLRIAVRNDREEVVRLLLDAGLKPDGGIEDALARIRDGQDRTILSLLVEHGWNINEPTSDFGPPVLGAIIHDESLIRWCLSLGADPNAASPSGTTILQCAASHGSLNVIQLLVAAGGKFASPSPSDDVVAYAVDRHSDSNNRLDVINYLLDNGADINTYFLQNRNLDYPTGLDIYMGKQTALHLAVGKGNGDLVEMLLKRGADTRAKMWNLNTVEKLFKGRTDKRIDAGAYAQFLGFGDIADIIRRTEASRSMIESKL